MVKGGAVFLFAAITGKTDVAVKAATTLALYQLLKFEP